MKAAELYIGQVREWAATEENIRALALIGPHVQENPRPGSDINFVLLCRDSTGLLDDISWVKKFGKTSRIKREQWGIIYSVRVFYRDGQGIEYGVAPLNWPEITFGDRLPADISKRLKVLKDADNLLVKFR